MKRFLVTCSLALALTALAEQKASAWNKFNFNIGMNISHESAETNFLWGAFRSGPHPFAHGGGGDHGYGGGQGGGHGGFSGQYYNPMPQASVPAPAQIVPVSQPPVSQADYQQIGYQYWSPATGYYTVPSYWYGR